MAAVLALGAASSARAGGIMMGGPNRPDLLDINQTFLPKDPAGDASGSSVRIAAGNYYYFGYVGAYGSISGSDGSNSASLAWTIFEPDVTRRGMRLAEATQRAYLLLSVRMSGASSLTTTTLVSGCGAHARVVESRRTGLRKASWSVSCQRDSLQELGLSDAQIDALASALGLRHPRLRNRGQTPEFE